MQRTWCHRNARPLTLNACTCRPAASPASSMSHSRMLRTNDCRRKPRPAIGPEKKRFHPWTSIASERPRGAAEQQEPPGPPDDSPITKSLSQRREGAHPTLPPAPCLLTQPTGLCSSRQGRAVAMATGGSPQLGGVTKGYGGISYLPAPDALGRSGGALEGELFSAVAIDSEERRLQVGRARPGAAAAAGRAGRSGPRAPGLTPPRPRHSQFRCRQKLYLGETTTAKVFGLFQSGADPRWRFQLSKKVTFPAMGTKISTRLRYDPRKSQVKSRVYGACGAGAAPAEQD